MRDRTKQLGNIECSDQDDEGSALVVKTENDDIENDAFFTKVQEIRQALETLRKKVSELENNQKTVLGVPLPEESMKKDLQTLRDEIKTMAGQIQMKLKSIEPKKIEFDGEYIPIHLRIRRTQHGVLSKEFVELTCYCNTIQAQYRDRNVERIQRQLRITGNSVTDEELDAMLESGQTDVFTHNLLLDHRFERMRSEANHYDFGQILNDAKATKQALNEIETRHDEILKLERSIRDLHDMFMQLATTVEEQGEMVNRIEENILKSSNYVEKAKDDVSKAVTYQRSTRKKKVWIAVCVAILILILVITLSSTFGS